MPIQMTGVVDWGGGGGGGTEGPDPAENLAKM